MRGLSYRAATDADARAGRLWVVERGGEVVATFTLGPQKIGFYHKGWFHEPDAPALYLTNMAVRPELQRRGIGRWTMRAIERLAREADARAVRLDSYDAKAGAGSFYRKCGYRRVHRGAIGGTRLEYHEKTLG